MAELRYNLVSFLRAGSPAAERVFLQLDGDWVQTAGLQPNVNSAICTRAEFAKLPAVLLNVMGSIELWWSVNPLVTPTAAPDHTLAVQALVDVQVIEWGSIPGTPGTLPLVRRLYFSDARQVFAPNRGGVLFRGRVNADPLPAGGSLLTNSQLMTACLDAVGLTGTIATTVNDIEPPRDLAWDGVSAGAALGELLDHTGHVATIAATGLIQIWKPLTGTLPSVPAERLVRSVTASAIDRRASELVLISSPEPEIDTWTDAASTGRPAWEYVVQDPADGQWKPIATVAADPLTQFTRFTMDRRVAEQAYRCIRIDQAKYPKHQVSLLAETIDTSLATRTPFLRLTTGKVAIVTEQGQWVNNTATVDVVALEVIPEEGVIVFDRPLGKLADRSSGPVLRPFFAPVATDDLRPTFSVEGYDSVAGTVRYSVFGFNVSAGAATPMSEAEARARLTGFRPWVEHHARPDLRVIKVNGGDSSNRSTLETRAEDMALALGAADALTTTQIEAKGFFAWDLSGRVAEIRYSQARATTTLVCDTFSTASRRIERRGPLTRSAEPLSRINPLPAAQEGGETIAVEIAGAISGQLGRYNGKSIAGDIGGASGNLAKADLGTPAPANDVIVWCLPDIGGSTPVLEDGQVVTGLRVGASSSGVPIIVVSGAGAGGDLPTPSARYQVLSVTAYTSSSVYTVGWSYPRAH